MSGMIWVGRFGKRKVKRVSYVVEVVDQETQSVDNAYEVGVSLSGIDGLRRRLYSCLDWGRYSIRMRVMSREDDV